MRRRWTGRQRKGRHFHSLVSYVKGPRLREPPPQQGKGAGVVTMAGVTVTSEGPGWGLGRLGARRVALGHMQVGFVSEQVTV